MKRIALNWGSVKAAIFVILGALISCLFVFINKYPFVYADTASYIYSGFNGLVFDDRPIFYGLFLRHISLHETPWLVVFAQSIILSYLIYLTLGIFVSGVRRNYLFIVIIFFITLTTGFSFMVGILTPDAFTPITLLCFLNLVVNKSLGRIHIISLSVFFVLGICSQLSTLVSLLFVFLVLGIFVLIKKIRSKGVGLNLRRLTLIFCLWFSCFLIVPGVHYFFSGRFALSGASHVFIMNHFLETGVLSEYLNEECGKKSYRICEYKDKLDWNFIWSEDSPVQKTGGWAANKQEYTEIIKDIVSRPKYLRKLSVAGIAYTIRQFFTFDAEVHPPELQGSQVFIQIGWRFKNTKEQYLTSMQSKSLWNLDWLNIIQWFVVLLSFGLILFLLLNKKIFKALGKEFIFCMKFICLFIVISCFVCSNLSTIDPRFQSRLIWLFPMFGLIGSFVYRKTIFSSFTKYYSQ